MRSAHAPACLPLSTCLLLIGAAVVPVQAQETEPPAPDSVAQNAAGGGGFFAIGVNATNLGPLNNRLSSTGYPTFPSELFAIGGGGYGVVGGRVLLGGEGYGLIGPSRGVQGREVSVGGGYGLFTLGYQFRPVPSLTVYPQVGLGGGGLVLDIGSAGADQFDDVLENPSRSATLEQGSLLLSLGAGVEYRVRSSGDDGGWHLGVRAGYLLAPYTTDWTLDENRLADSPDATLGGPFVRVLIGGWGGD